MTALVKQGYKVLRDNRSSIWVRRSYALHYPVRRKVHRQLDCGPLAVFTTLHAANHFVIHLNGWHGDLNFTCLVVRCSYKPSEDYRLWIDPNPRRPVSVPAGTDFADFLTCKE